MTTTPHQADLYEKNINFLIGAGASAGLFPTLQLALKDGEGKWVTVETLATMFEASGQSEQKTALFAYYYQHVIEVVLKAKYETLELLHDAPHQYKEFLTTILLMLNRKRAGEPKRCNIFTTNYDGCLEFAADQLLKESPFDFCVNDGAKGFQRRVLDAKNFNQSVTEMGVFGRHRTEIPQININHLHGSVYWHRHGDSQIIVDYWKDSKEREIQSDIWEACSNFSKVLQNDTLTTADLPKVAITEQQMAHFWEQYNKLPIVNPTKWKFHETVFDEHYYQMLRHLSYELERPNSVLLVFGFSFADEHIRNLVKRSLSNPGLQMFVYCFRKADVEFIQKMFAKFPNVKPIGLDDKNIDFKEFNSLLTSPPKTTQQEVQIA
jgi:hypothetical protein